LPQPTPQDFPRGAPQVGPPQDYTPSRGMPQVPYEQQAYAQPGQEYQQQPPAGYAEPMMPQPEFAQPDFAQPDFAQSDLAQPDFAQSDLARPDFAPPTEFISSPVVPSAPEQMAPALDESPSGSIRVDKEIRSHRTGSKPAKRSDDKTSTQELDRLLGFFDEIRKAKAWDEESAQPEPARKGRGSKRRR
jgi:hypothetical protein